MTQITAQAAPEALGGAGVLVYSICACMAAADRVTVEIQQIGLLSSDYFRE
jgi:hypothetical protein